jgi:hypothetical protein
MIRIRSLLVVALVACGLLVACGKTEPGRTPSGGKISCASDSGCVVTNHTTCCSCCDGPPVALPNDEHARLENKCAAADCPACSASIACAKVEPVSAFVARCIDGTCAAVHH